MGNRVSLPIIHVLELGSPDQLFRCEPLTAVMTGSSCVKRQDEAHRPKTIGDGARFGSRDHLVKCADCAVGRQVRKQVGHVPLAAREQRRTIAPKHRGTRKEFASPEVELFEQAPKALRGQAATVEAELSKSIAYTENLEMQIAAMSVDLEVARSREADATRKLAAVESELSLLRRKHATRSELATTHVDVLVDVPTKTETHQRKRLVVTAMALAAHAFAVDRLEVWHRKTASAATARAVALYVYRRLTQKSSTDIGVDFGIEHTVVLDALSKVENKLGDKFIGPSVASVERELQEEVERMRA
jgi:hypothetical protein